MHADADLCAVHCSVPQLRSKELRQQAHTQSHLQQNLWLQNHSKQGMQQHIRQAARQPGRHLLSQLGSSQALFLLQLLTRAGHLLPCL